jgi:hypothetical protein
MTSAGRYWQSPWPGEDGGPRREQAPHREGGLALRSGGTLTVTSRSVIAPTMVVLRDPGEVFVQGNTMDGEGTAWVERVDPVSLAPLARSPDLAGGPFWPGGVAAHANRDLYVTFGCFCHRLAAGCSLVASRELPRERPYNSLVVLPDGHLVMKDFDLTTTEPAQLAVLEPEGLEVVATADVGEASIAG